MPCLRHTIEQILAKLREMEIWRASSLTNDTNDNHILVRVSWCWWYQQYTGYGYYAPCFPLPFATTATT
jgi:hypothetical protein